jgi:hypothetical protein
MRDPKSPAPPAVGLCPLGELLRGEKALHFEHRLELLLKHLPLDLGHTLDEGRQRRLDVPRRQEGIDVRLAGLRHLAEKRVKRRAMSRENPLRLRLLRVREADALEDQRQQQTSRRSAMPPHPPTPCA